MALMLLPVERCFREYSFIRADGKPLSYEDKRRINTSYAEADFDGRLFESAPLNWAILPSNPVDKPDYSAIVFNVLTEDCKEYNFDEDALVGFVERLGYKLKSKK